MVSLQLYILEQFKVLQLHLPKTHFLLFPLVLPLMSEDLAAGVQHIVAVRPDAVDMITSSAKPAIAVRTRLVLHVFLETIFGKSFVFDVVCLMLLCGKKNGNL